MQRDGDIYNRDFLARLKRLTEAISTLPGINAAQLHSLFTPDTRFIEVVEGGFFGGDVIPAEYSVEAPTPEMLSKVRADVAKAGIIGRLISDDQRGAMIEAEVLEVDPVSGMRVDYSALAQQLDDRIGNLAESEQTPGSALRLDVHIVGFAKAMGDVIDEAPHVLSFVLIALAVTTILLWLFRGSFKLAVLPIVAAVTAVIWEFGLLRMIGFGLDPAAILVPLLILTISLSHGLQQVNGWTSEIAQNGCSRFDARLITWRHLA
jgi:predicted RND superfamily exporter protein